MADRSGLFGSRITIVIAALVTVCVIGSVFFFTSPLVKNQSRPSTPSPGPAFAVPAEPVNGTVDQPCTWYQYGGQGTITVRSVRWERTGNQPPSNGNQYLVLDIEITATAGSLTVNPLYLSAVNSDGGEVFLATMAGYEPELQQLTLESGQGIRANATFETPPEKTKVIFTEELMDPVAVIEVPGPG